ncbi:lipoyl(octanoyl) transferase LipB [Aestuariimicrobium sp. p3-SID1156]|uniref:lipoyl(octanoyl) transferase LipB n=1 Tax=Aestuariimicrobium sp. p3-SID1156 TaxID=2916038 RepID=UPI00223AB795|nr:lipoyl(octanoyl) transferase LipB [Aestuariimicrobium sp. p3-SID1156]MCT1459537.1 lipoyl(octanoyl) transferase LipB [Aestuariimicrobium sp. p3-SID1156]
MSEQSVQHPEGLEFQYLGFTEDPPRLSPYLPTWDYQREVQARVASHETPDQVLYVEHEPVYTAGRKTEPHERPFDGTPVVDVDRGGKITWHGPGQLVGYPIVHLPDRVGVVDYVRRVEEAIIRYLATLGLQTGRVRDRTGVWLAATGPEDPRGPRPERKICAIGIRVSRRTTIHGFALNLSNTIGGFDNIVPCGISDAGVTSVGAELSGPGELRRPGQEGWAPTLEEAGRALEPFLTEMLRFEPYESSPDLEATSR